MNNHTGNGAPAQSPDSSTSRPYVAIYCDALDALQRVLPSEAMRLLMALMRNTNARGTASPGVRDIWARTGLHPEEQPLWIKWLEARHLIRVFPRDYRDPLSGQWMSTVYALTPHIMRFSGQSPVDDWQDPFKHLIGDEGENRSGLIGNFPHHRSEATIVSNDSKQRSKASTLSNEVSNESKQPGFEKVEVESPRKERKTRKSRATLVTETTGVVETDAQADGTSNTPFPEVARGDSAEHPTLRYLSELADGGAEFVANLFNKRIRANGQPAVKISWCRYYVEAYGIEAVQTAMNIYMGKPQGSVNDAAAFTIALIKKYPPLLQPEPSAPAADADATRDPAPQPTHAPAADATPEARAWEAAHHQFQKQYDQQAFDSVLRDARLHQVQPTDPDIHPSASMPSNTVLGQQTFVILVKTDAARELLQNRYYRNVRRVLSDTYGQPVELRFEVAKAEPLFAATGD